MPSAADEIAAAGIFLPKESTKVLDLAVFRKYSCTQANGRKQMESIENHMVKGNPPEIDLRDQKVIDAEMEAKHQAIAKSLKRDLMLDPAIADDWNSEATALHSKAIARAFIDAQESGDKASFGEFMYAIYEQEFEGMLDGRVGRESKIGIKAIPTLPQTGTQAELLKESQALLGHAQVYVADVIKEAQALGCSVPKTAKLFADISALTSKITNKIGGKL